MGFFLLSFHFCVIPYGLPTSSLSTPFLHTYVGPLQIQGLSQISLLSAPAWGMSLCSEIIELQLIICGIYFVLNYVVSCATFFFVVPARYLNILLLVNFRHIYTYQKMLDWNLLKKAMTYTMVPPVCLAYIHPFNNFWAPAKVEWLINNQNKVKYMYIIEYKTWYFTIQVLSHLIVLVTSFWSRWEKVICHAKHLISKFTLTVFQVRMWKKKTFSGII